VLDWLKPDPRRDMALEAVYGECQDRLRGCGPLEAERALRGVIEMMRCKRPSDAICAGYIAIMERYPKGLLLHSVANAVAREKYHVLPAAGALVADAEAELERQRARVAELRRAIGKLHLSRKLGELRASRRTT
jgi:hypothetical protein